MKYESFSFKDTYDIAYKLGAKSKKGEIYCLNGDLGAGKTVFAKGFAKALNVKEDITSPTFTIINEYKSGKISLYHFDVYRVTSIEEMYETGYEEYFYSDGICLIEWSNLIEEIIPKNATYISIEKDLFKDENYRVIYIGEYI